METSKTTLTIGMFDGLHLGHQSILNSLEGTCVAITFINHPSTVLGKNSPPLLMFPSHRIGQLKNFVDQVHVLPFTQELSKLSAEDFLLHIRKTVPFTHLVLGHDGVIGCNREGTPDKLVELAEKLDFKLTYLSPISLDGQIVSSSVIRQALQKGDLKLVSKLLGRPYSILGTVTTGAGAGHAIGFPTANLSISGLALPPLGVYSVQVNGKQAIANLGKAPTLHENRPTTLEVHLLDESPDLYGKEIEVVFQDFIRPERSFDSIEALQAQIKEDIYACKNKITSPSLTM